MAANVERIDFECPFCGLEMSFEGDGELNYLMHAIPPCPVYLESTAEAFLEKALLEHERRTGDLTDISGDILAAQVAHAAGDNAATYRHLEAAVDKLTGATRATDKEPS